VKSVRVLSRKAGRLREDKLQATMPLLSLCRRSLLTKGDSCCGLSSRSFNPVS